MLQIKCNLCSYSKALVFQAKVACLHLQKWWMSFDVHRTQVKNMRRIHTFSSSEIDIIAFLP